MNTVSQWAMRVGIGATLAVSGVIHAYLYIHGYNHVPTVGPAFLLQASMFCALAVLVLAGGPYWLQLAGALLSGDRERALRTGFAANLSVTHVADQANWEPFRAMASAVRVFRWAIAVTS